MKLYYDRKSSDPTYFIQQGIRNGKKTTTKNVKRIGKHSEILKFHDDPLAYAKSEVEKYNKEFKESKIADLSFTINFDEKVQASDSVSSKSINQNIGYIFLQDIYHQLNMSKFFDSVTKDRKMTFDCNTINRFLTVARILDPRSKYGTADHLDFYFENPDFDYQHILRFMDILDENYDAYLNHLFESSNKIIKRNTSVCYYDCTNYYFETEKEKDEYVDEVTGEVIIPYGRYGLSKQHQPSPIVEMGLFMDSDGIPLSMCIHPGNTNEQTTAIPCEKKLIDMLDNKQIIYCADAGLGSYDIRNFNDKGGRAYIVTQSIKKLPNKLKDAIFTDIDYKLLSNDASFSLEDMKSFDKNNKNLIRLYNDEVYKVIEAPVQIDIGLTKEKNSRKVKDKAVLKQRVIVTYSRKAAEYQRTIREKQIERAKSILEKTDPEKIKKGPNDVRRFIKNNGDYNYELDEQRIEEESRYDGFYAVVTNLNDNVKDILEINSRRYKIEDCFRTLKTYFNARPINHQINSRIRAHFTICYTALLIYRILEYKLTKKGYHFTVEKIIETLKNMNVINQKDLYYQATYTGSQICSALIDTFDYPLDKRYHLPKELRKMFKKISR